MTRIISWLIVVTLIAGCSRDSSSPVTGKNGSVRLALNWVPEPEFGGFYAARESGGYAEHGLNVEILAGGAGLPTVQMAAAGQVEFAIVSADEVVINRARGGDVVALFAVYQDCPQGIMTHASRGFTSLADVFANSGTVAMEPGLPYAKFVEKLHGLSKVKVVPFSGGITQFLADPNYSQQCFVFAEPVAARQQGADPKVFLVSETGYNPYTAVVVTNGDYLRQNPDVVKRFVTATRAGWEAYLKDPAPANAVMGRLNTAMDARTFAEAAEAQLPLVTSEQTKAHGLGAMTLERWTELGQQLVELGIIEQAPDPAACFLAAE